MCSGADYRRILRRGRRRDGPLFVALMLANSVGVRRIGLAVSRRVGGAVRRNRAKRLLRECFRLDFERLPPGTDIVLIAKPELRGRTLREVRDEFDRRFQPRRAGARGPAADRRG